jgi:hypothetical protein
MSAAILAAREALETASPDDADDQSQQTTPLRAIRLARPRRSARRPRAGSAPAGVGPAGVGPAGVEPIGPLNERPATIRGVARGAARSLLVTPWFAAGAGFVLAAGLWVYSPHTELKFPTANAPYGVPCTTMQCGPAGNGQLATSSPSKRIVRQTTHGRAAQPDVTGRHASNSGLTFTFAVPWQQNDGFQALITVRGKHLPATWRLEFTMPGTHIRYVIGAQWQPSPNGDGGTAFAPQFGGGQGQDQNYGQDDGYGPNPGGYRRQGGSISILVMGSGTPGTPTNCVFNGASCTFN